MGYNTNKIKDRAIELEDNYPEARDEEFNDAIRLFLKDNGDNIITEEDIEQMIQGFDADFPDSMTWAWEQVESEIGDIEDQKHEMWKDERDD